MFGGLERLNSGKNRIKIELGGQTRGQEGPKAWWRRLPSGWAIMNTISHRLCVRKVLCITWETCTAYTWCMQPFHCRFSISRWQISLQMFEARIRDANEDVAEYKKLALSLTLIGFSIVISAIMIKGYGLWDFIRLTPSSSFWSLLNLRMDQMVWFDCIDISCRQARM